MLSLSFWNILNIVFSILIVIVFIVLFVIMIYFAIKQFLVFKSFTKLAKKSKFNIFLVILLFAFGTAMVSGTINSAQNIRNKVNNEINEYNLHDSVIDISAFAVDSSGDMKGEVKLLEIYNDFEANNFQEIINYLYVGQENPPSTPNVDRTQVERDFAINLIKDDGSFFEQVDWVNDSSTQSLVHVFYVLKKIANDDLGNNPHSGDLTMIGEISYKYLPNKKVQLTNDGDIIGGALINTSDIRLFRDEEENLKGITHFNNQSIEELNKINFRGGNIPTNNAQAMVFEPFTRINNLSYGDTIQITSSAINLEIVGNISVPYSIIPPGAHGRMVLGDGTNNSSFTLVTNDYFDLMVKESGIYSTGGVIGVGYDQIRTTDLGDENHSTKKKNKIRDLNDNLNDFLTNYFVSIAPAWMMETSENESEEELINNYATEFPVVRTYFDQLLLSNNGVLKAYSTIDMLDAISWVMSTFFIVIVLILSIMFVKRRIDQNIKQVATLKGLGYPTRSIATGFMIYPLLIVLVGGIFGASLSFAQEKYWFNFFSSKFIIAGASYSVISPIATIITSIILPLIIVISISYLLAIYMLKKNVVQQMKGETQGKPNAIVRAFSKTSNNLNFESAYVTKGIFRSLGKSAFIASSIVFATILLIFSSSADNFIDLATKSTQNNFTLETGVVLDKKYDFIDDNDSQIVGQYSNYNFGAEDMPQIQYRAVGINRKRLVNKKAGYDFDYDLDEHHRLWQNAFVDYAETTDMSQDYRIVANFSYLDLNDFSTALAACVVLPTTCGWSSSSELPIFWIAQQIDSQYKTNIPPNQSVGFLQAWFSTKALIREINEANREDLLTKNLESISGGVTYTNLTISNIVTKLDGILANMVLGMALGIEDLIEKIPPFPEDPNKILSWLQDVAMVLFPLVRDTGVVVNKIHVNSQLGYDSKVTILQAELLDKYEGISTIFHMPKNDEWEKFYDMKNIYGNSINSSVYKYENDSRIPMLVDYWTAKRLNIKNGETIKMSIPGVVTASGNSEEADFVVAEIYEAYFPLGFAIYRNAAADLIFGLDDGYNSRISNGGVFSSSYVTYTNPQWDGSNNNWFLLDPSNTGIQAFVDFKSPLIMVTPFSLVGETVKVVYVQFDLIINSFLLSSFILIAFVLVIVIKEIIDETRGEVATLKALGYSTSSTTRMVISSQVFLMFLSLLLAIPLSIGFLVLFETMLFTIQGTIVSLSTSYIYFGLVALGMIGVILIVYALAYVVYYKVRGYESLQNL